jgi:hypothetical protein
MDSMDRRKFLSALGAAGAAGFGSVKLVYAQGAETAAEGTAVGIEGAWQQLLATDEYGGLITAISETTGFEEEEIRRLASLAMVTIDNLGRPQLVVSKVSPIASGCFPRPPINPAEGPAMEELREGFLVVNRNVNKGENPCPPPPVFLACLPPISADPK